MKKQTLYIIGIIILLAIFFIFSNKKSENITSQNNSQINETASSSISSLQKATDSGTWEGLLKTSNNLKKGNLMLVTKDRTIYLKTNRNFSNLLEKTVLVNFEGNLDNFLLGNIFEKPTSTPINEQ